MNYPTNELEETPLGDRDEYIVKKGDTLYKIAQMFNTTVANIMQTNGLSTPNLNIGQLLVIPKRPQPMQMPKDMKEHKDNFEEYMVEKGDTLYSIAQATNTTTDELININSLASSTIFPGQVLLVPKRVPSGAITVEEYTTQENDTIESIARKLGVNPVIIGFYNDFSKLMLSPNQKINIPRRPRTYTITDGDTPETITSRNKLAYRELVELNRSTWLKPGSRINIG
jgi:LysM repeat protein